jgi:hypothetical protein
LLSAVDVVGGAGNGGVGHEVHGERGDVGWADDALDRERAAEVLAAGVELIAEEDGGQRVSTNPAAIRLTRIGASSRARFLVSAGIAAVRAPISANPGAVRRPPVPPMNSRVPPWRTLPVACRATSSGSSRWASMSRRAFSRSSSASGA